MIVNNNRKGNCVVNTFIIRYIQWLKIDVEIQRADHANKCPKGTG